MVNRAVDSYNFRYRTLFLLLPFANGALLIAGYAFMRGYLGVPEARMATTSGGSADYLADFFWRAFEFLATCMVIYWINLLVVSVVYCRSFKWSLRQLLGFSRDRPKELSGVSSKLIINLAAAIPLTFAGYIVTLYSLNALALWPGTGEMMTHAMAITLSIVFAGTIEPLMADGEQTQSDGEPSNSPV